jgi:hypothetical protein
MRPTSDEVRDAHRRLCDWQGCEEMRIATEQLMDKLDSEDLFSQSGLTFILEAWAAAKFGYKRGAVSARLITGVRPDCELMFPNGAIEAFEIVEGDVLGRKRGPEYRERALTGKARHSPVEEWATPEQAREIIQNRAEKKARKARDLASAGIPYPPGTGLLIYLNISDFGVNHEAIKAEFAPSVHVATSWFASIWILWKDVPYHVFGAAASTPS